MRALAFALVLGVGMSASASPPTWRLDLQTLPEYVAGFPLPIALTLTNATSTTGVNDVPGWSPWDLGRAQLTITFADGGGKRHEIALPRPVGDPMGDHYGPGQARRMLFDLSLVEGRPPPGSYSLRVTFAHRGQSATSNEARFVLHAPDHDDAAAATRLSHGAPWSEFVAANWHTITVPHLSAAARHQLALHLFVQRSVYGPEKLADQPLTWLEPLGHGLFAPEAELYRIELLAARHDPHARAISEALTAHTPGLRDAAAAALAGQGELGFLRHSSGAERGDPPGPIPYPH